MKTTITAIAAILVVASTASSAYAEIQLGLRTTQVGGHMESSLMMNL